MKSISLKKNAILNVIKQILKIAFPLITFPYVSRVLLEDNFGKYNFSLSIISYFQLIAGLGISSYAIREGARIRDDKKRFRVSRMLLSYLPAAHCWKPRRLQSQVYQF